VERTENSKWIRSLPNNMKSEKLSINNLVNHVKSSENYTLKFNALQEENVSCLQTDLALINEKNVPMLVYV
jgi:hypothetical protein